MNISQERLREIVRQVLLELQAEQGAEPKKEQTLYMVCGDDWNQEYEKFLLSMEGNQTYRIYPVVPTTWQGQSWESSLKRCAACAGILYRSGQERFDLEQAVSVFPVVSRDTLVKTALCISDTFETAWVADCIRQGGRMIFLRSGLERFSGREAPAYVAKIMEYLRQVLEYGVELCLPEEIGGAAQRRQMGVASTDAPRPEKAAAPSRKKRVITASNVEQLAVNGVLSLKPDDIVTDLARDRAKFLNIILK